MTSTRFRSHGWVVALLSVVLLALPALSAANPEITSYSAHDGHAKFGNGYVTATWEVRQDRLVDLAIHDEINHASIRVTAPFKLTLADKSTLGVDDLRLVSPPHEVALRADSGASRLAARLPGDAVTAEFVDATGKLRVDWRLVQRQGSRYLREVITIHAVGQPVHITRVDLLDADATDAHVVGDVHGSPVIAGHDYLGFEQPMSDAFAWAGKAQLWMERKLPLETGKSVTYSAVAGATRPTQLRRDFAAYVERERAHPYRPFLNYNSWYDLGAVGTLSDQVTYTQAQALERINVIGTQLVVDRHVQLDSFVFDDGWDDHQGDWKFSRYFPDGFVPLCQAAKKYGAAPGIWLSPWGGYESPHAERVAGARKLGYGIVDGSLALSAPKYWRRFHHVVMDLLNRDGINNFKFDGTGNVNFAYPGSLFDSDFAAAIQLIEDIRADKPNTFVNLTTGTWASPFWLRYADSIWRGGFDHNFAGVGSEREQWITYRDEQTYRNIVEKGPLFPLNSLMLHGIIYAQFARGLKTATDQGFANGVHDFFASGTDLQEFLVTPALLNQNNWNVLAEAAKWARANAKVLEDTHWIGGDPGRLDVYGWAAWTPQKAFITFRNPSDQPQLAVVSLTKQLQLPPGAARRYAVNDVWHGVGATVPRNLDADQPVPITLQPFEVLTLALRPIAGGAR
jgi:hypothetical protein